MSLKKTSLRIKIFIVLTVLTAFSSVAMIFLGMRISESKTELRKAKAASANIEKYGKEIGGFRAKISAQKKAIGGSNVELTPTEIAKACGRNNAVLDKTTPIPDLDHGDYLEVGYRVTLNSILKIDLARLYADLEMNIPGCKIKAHNMSAARNGVDQWVVNFTIVKSVPKISE